MSASPDAILSVLSRMLLSPARWDRDTNTLDQMLGFFSHFDEDLAQAVRQVLERRAGLSVETMNARGTPYSIEVLLLDGLVSVARNWPPKPGDLNPLTGDLIMAKPTKTVSGAKRPEGRGKLPSMEKAAAKKSMAKSGKVSK